MPITLEQEAQAFFKRHGDIEINWEGLATKGRTSLGQEKVDFHRIFDNLLDYLYQEGVLTFENAEGSFFLISPAGNVESLESQRSECKYHFKNKDDAIRLCFSISSRRTTKYMPKFRK